MPFGKIEIRVTDATSSDGSDPIRSARLIHHMAGVVTGDDTVAAVVGGGTTYDAGIFNPTGVDNQIIIQNNDSTNPATVTFTPFGGASQVANIGAGRIVILADVDLSVALTLIGVGGTVALRVVVMTE